MRSRWACFLSWHRFSHSCVCQQSPWACVINSWEKCRSWRTSQIVQAFLTSSSAPSPESWWRIRSLLQVGKDQLFPTNVGMWPQCFPLDFYLLTDGYSYEREAIDSWIQTRNRSSPMTNLPLVTTLLTPNHTLKMAIGRWKTNRAT